MSHSCIICYNIGRSLGNKERSYDESIFCPSCTAPICVEGRQDKIVDTIAETAAFYGKKVITDERLREREKGMNGNNHSMFQRRWADKDFHEEGGESLHMVQNRNMEAFCGILKQNAGENIVIGTHGTALSTILNYYDETFGLDDFLRIIDYMPYIIELDFEGEKLAGVHEHVYVEKIFQGKERADK